MSEKRYLECDQCNHRDDISGDNYGAPRRHWTTVTKPVSSSQEPISAGVMTFCCDNCVIGFAKSIDPLVEPFVP